MHKNTSVLTVGVYIAAQTPQLDLVKEGRGK